MGKTKVEYWFDPLSDVNISSSKKKEALQEVADLVLESILTDVSKGVSPVTGKEWQELSEEYKAYKKKETGSSSKISNLSLHGDLLESLIVKPSKGGILITVGNSQNAKAAGHNHWYGKPTVPERKFIPNASKKETLSEDILKDIKYLLKDYED